jgi:histidinol-phosphate phosphatase family protein
MSSRVVRPFVFVDRDGTLVRDSGYVHRIADYALLPGVVVGLRRLAHAGFEIAVVTNQSGIARGYYGEMDFARFQAHLEADLASQGVRVAGHFFARISQARAAAVGNRHRGCCSPRTSASVPISQRAS